MLEKLQSDIKPDIIRKAYTTTKVLIEVNVGVIATAEGFAFNSFSFRKDKEMTYGEILDEIYQAGVFDSCTADELCSLAEELNIDASVALDQIKRIKLSIIDDYDSSPAVNSFSFQGVQFWLDKATRVGLMNSTSIQKSAGYDDTTLWFGNTNITLPCDKVISILSQIEMYALQCYNVTAMHKTAIGSLEAVEEILSYDHKCGYPSQLTF